MIGDPSEPGHPPGVRASDSDRERTVELLRRHQQEGRLTTEEVATRVDSAQAARTVGELDALLADLPDQPTPPPSPAAASPPAPAAGPRRGQPTRQAFYRTLWTFLVLDLFSIGVWAFTGAGYFWPIWLILGSSVTIAFSAINVFLPRQRGS
ncbi:MAG TPA: DUF1707 domain-containing protein [Actinomycetes bacterium]|nr:DUF1707 domain-containing protein [Actinomycetes bacterium]